MAKTKPPIGDKRGPAFDWPLIRSEYVEGIRDGDKTIWPTQADLIRMHGMAEGTIAPRAAREKWDELRKEFQRKLDERRRAKKVEALADKAAGWDSNGLSVAEALLAIAVGAIREANERDAKGKLVRRTSPADLGKLTRAAKDAFLMGRIAIGNAMPGVNSPFGSGAIGPNGMPMAGVVRYEWVNGPDPTAVDYD